VAEPLPDVGDIAWIDFDPAKGTEQAGRRPALVLTPLAYHQRSRRAVVCPITSSERIWPFNVVLPSGLRTRGSVLVDQVRAVERAERMFGIIERAPFELIIQVRLRLAALLGFDIISAIAPSDDPRD
jgi:mRNA interferase MazF